MVIIMIARHWQGDYVQTAHVRMGKKVGLSQAVIDALVAGNDPKLTDPHEARGAPVRRRHDRQPRSCRTPSSPRSRRRSAAPVSPRCWC